MIQMVPSKEKVSVNLYLKLSISKLGKASEFLWNVKLRGYIIKYRHGFSLDSPSLTERDEEEERLYY